jgi:PD-(D/E)XK nuclease superfamily
MIVSFSGIQQFRRCQRQWCFDKLVASSQAKNNPLRREIYLLSQLQSLAAWRGDVVDHVITRRVIPALEKGWMIRRDALLTYARSIFDARLSFALQNRLREGGMTQRKAGDSFSALMPVDYGEDVSEGAIAKAWDEVEQGLLNLMDMNELLDLLRSASKLIAQRPLILPHFQVHFRAVPDVIAFFNHAPPLIVDWKVHTRGTQEYRLQLAAYALALTRCKPHNDFPEALSGYLATDIRLLEAQLLTKRL